MLFIAYTLITLCCDDPQTVIDLMLYEVKYYNYIIIKLNIF